MIIPVVHEGEKINEILDSIKSASADVSYETIVVDGDLSGNTISHISDPGVITLTAPRGRALQMNAGAARACGDILLFLHADTLLPPKAFTKIITALSNSNFIGGAFDLKIQNHRWIFRAIGRAASWKHRLTRVPYGDRLRLAGAGSITVSEPQEARRKSALQFGADLVIDPAQTGDHLSGASHGHGFDFVIDAVGSATTFEQAVNSAARGGTILLFGVASMPATAAIRPFEVYARELTIVGSFINPYTHDRAVRLLPQMELDNLPINAFPLEKFQDAFAAQAKGGPAKVELLPQG